MKRTASLLCLFALLSALVSVVAAAEDESKSKATTPEVQTAAWAVKWWGPRHEQKLKDLKATKGKVDLLMIGDSITHGWETSGKKVWDEFYADRNAFNIGYSGDRTEQVVWRLQHGEVEGIAPKLAVIMIGTNNTGHREDPPKETAAGIKLIIEELRKRTPKTKILLLAIFPRGAKADDKLRKINDGTNEIIKGYADDKTVFFLDINKTFLEEDGTLPKSVMPDLLHPKEPGYRMWAEAMEPMIAKLLGEDDA